MISKNIWWVYIWALKTNSRIGIARLCEIDLTTIPYEQYNDPDGIWGYGKGGDCAAIVKLGNKYITWKFV